MPAYDLTPRPLNAADPAPDYPWPQGARSAVFIGFDVDAESVWLSRGAAYVERLVTASHGGFDARVGVPRLLDLLAELDLRATFFIPGWTALAHPRMCESILRGGHEVAHHGYLHRAPDPERRAEAIDEVDRGFAALQQVLGVRPVGYRAPGGENFPALLSYLAQQGIRYSSSWRDDIRPYRHRLADGGPGPVEIPVNFALDDWNYGMSNRASPRPLFGRDVVLPAWRAEFEAMHAWGGVSTLVLHPQVSGRPMRWQLLRDFLAPLRGRGDLWFATGAEITAHFEQCERKAKEQMS